MGIPNLERTIAEVEQQNALPHSRLVADQGILPYRMDKDLTGSGVSSRLYCGEGSQAWFLLVS